MSSFMNAFNKPGKCDCMIMPHLFTGVSCAIPSSCCCGLMFMHHLPHPEGSLTCSFHTPHTFLSPTLPGKKYACRPQINRCQPKEATQPYPHPSIQRQASEHQRQKTSHRMHCLLPGWQWLGFFHPSLLCATAVAKRIIFVPGGGPAPLCRGQQPRIPHQCKYRETVKRQKLSASASSTTAR